LLFVSCYFYISFFLERASLFCAAARGRRGLNWSILVVVSIRYHPLGDMVLGVQKSKELKESKTE
jgi:hypothetical protein